jgi:hypothetical protein
MKRHYHQQKHHFRLEGYWKKWNPVLRHYSKKQLQESRFWPTILGVLALAMLPER